MKRMIHSKHWIGVCALVLAAAGFSALGRWQLERAAANRASAEGYSQAAGLPAIDRPVGSREADELRHRRIRLSGRYQAETQILLDNMTHRGQAGYQVLTPFRVAGQRLVLVNRGWIAASPDRSRLPDVTLTGDVSEITGRIGRLPLAALRFEAPAATAGSLVVMSFPDFADVEAVLGHEVHAFVVLLDPDAPDGFLRDWAPTTDRADRNIAYAVQWFGLAVLALALAIGVVVRGRRRQRESGA